MNAGLKIVRVLLACAIMLTPLLCSCGGGGEEGTEAGKAPVMNKPPVVSIDDPMNFAVYIQGDTVEFNGTGKDHEDGPLSGDSLVWTSSISGNIGTGASFSLAIAAGLHTITLTATDSDGATASEEITLNVSSIADTG